MKIGSDLGLMRLGDLDVVAQHIVEADFKRAYAGCVAVFLLQAHDQPLALVAQHEQLVERRIITRRNKIAVAREEAAIGFERRGQFFDQRLMTRQARRAG